MGRKRKKKRTEDKWYIWLGQYTDSILNFLISAYLLLIIVVMPFYHQEGYNHIGSDKSYFFRTYTDYAAKILIPFILLRLLCTVVENINKTRKENVESLRGKKNLSESGKENKLWKKCETWLKNWSATDFFALGYALSVVLSYAFTEYRDTALMGTTGWYMGTIPQLTLVGIYFVISRFWKGSDGIVYLFLPVSTVVFWLGLANRFGWYPIPMDPPGVPEFISTIGNINWYCGYMVCVLFLGVGMFWLYEDGKKWEKILLPVYCFVGFATAVTQGSDSGLLALSAVFLVLFVKSASGLGEERKPQRMIRFWQLVLLFSGACIFVWIVRCLFPNNLNYSSGTINLLTYSAFPFLLAIFGIAALWLTCRNQNDTKMASIYRVLARAACIIPPTAIVFLIAMIALNTTHFGILGPLSDKGIFTFNADWGSNRGATWMAGLRCFTDQNFLHKLVGVGPDCMADYIYQGGNKALRQSVSETFGKARLTNAHNEWLTILVCSGIFGVVSFAGMMISAIFRFIRKPTQNMFSFACGLCVLAYACNNIFSFQQSMSAVTIFLILGMGEHYLQKTTNNAIIR